MNLVSALKQEVVLFSTLTNICVLLTYQWGSVVGFTGLVYGNVITFSAVDASSADV